MNSSLPGMLFRLGFRRRNFLFGVQLVDLSMKRSPADSKLFRSGRYVSVRRRQRLENEFAFGFMNIQRAGFFSECFGWGNSAWESCAGRLAKRRRQIANSYFQSSRHDNAVLDRGAQFAHVTWPVVSEQRVHCFRR